MSELYEVLVSGDGTMSAIMSEREHDDEMPWFEGRVFCIPGELVEEVISSLFERRFGSYDPASMEHVELRRAIQARLCDCDDGTVAFGAETADLFSFGKYGLQEEPQDD